MIISHNTFSYKRPLKWWMRLLRPIARCQSIPLSEQVKRGVTCADMRITIIGGECYVSHGPVIYCTLEEALRECRENEIGNIRVLFEQDYAMITPFWNCPGISAFYFWTGRDKRTWKKIASRMKDVPNLTQHVASIQSRWGKCWPWLWAKLHCKEIRKQQIDMMLNYKYFSTEQSAAFDFV